MRRKLGKKNKILFVLFSFLIFILIVIFYLGIRLFINIGSKQYSVDSGSTVFDKNYSYIDVEQNGKIKKGYNGDYYLRMTKDSKNYKYNLGKTPVVFKNSDYKMYLYGKFYQVLLSGDVIKMNGRLEIIRDEGPYFYKLADRKYLIVDKNIESEDGKVKTSNYLIVEIDKKGNATFSNNELSEKTINPLVLNCSNFKFDIANEKLIISSKIINLKNIIGSSNVYKASTNKNGEVEKLDEDEITQTQTSNTANDYYATYFKQIVNSFNNLSNSVTNGSTKKDSEDINLDLTRWLSLSNVIPSVNSITVNYNVFDPNNEYSSVFLLIDSASWKSSKKIELSKESNSYILRELSPDNEYTITLGYSLMSNSSAEIYDDILKAKTTKPNYELKVTKVTGNKIYFNLKIDKSYVIDSGDIVLYSDGVKQKSININIETAVKSSGWTYSFDYNNLGNCILLKLENLTYNGENINLDVNFKYMN